MRTVLLMIFALLVLGCSSNVDEGALSYSPDAPELNEALTVSFHPEQSSSALAGSDDVHFRFTLVAGDGTLHSESIPMERHGNRWEASITPSDLLADPALLVCAFVDAEDPELFDNNQGQSWRILLNQDARLAPGAQFQNYRLLSGQLRLADVLTFPREREAAKDFIDLELALHPDNFRAQREKWLIALDGYGDEVPDSLIQHIDLELGKRLAGWQDWDTLPKEIVDMLDLYWKIDRRETMENIRDAMLERFQKTDGAREILHYKAMHEANMELRVEWLQNLHRIYPDWEGAKEDRGYIVYWSLGAMNNPDKAREVVDSGLPIEPSFGTYLAQRFTTMGDVDRAALLLTRGIEMLDENEWSPESIFSRGEWLRDNAMGRSAALYSLAELREREGRGREALPLLERIVDELPEFADAETLRALVAIQLRMKKFEEARATFEQLALEVELSPEELETWREHYEGEQPFLAHLAELRDTARKDAWAGFEKHVLNWDAPAAVFTDMEGDTLTLASLAGKVVLLDFWASWCGPCKLALPGLDKMTPGYVETGDFVMIPANTWERVAGEERKQTAKATWQTLGLSMPIYFDKERGEDRPAVEAFGVSGIPTSFLIGKNGKILFKTIGYGGEAGELELKSKIEWAMKK